MTGFSASRFGGLGVGGSPISNPAVAYVRADGSDEVAEIGNPAKPYLTATAAFTALKALHSDPTIQHCLNLGAGDFSLDLSVADVGDGYRIFAVGEGGSVDGVGEGGSTLTISSTGDIGTSGNNGESIATLLILRSNLTVKVILNLVAGEGGDGADGGDLTGNVYAWAANLDSSGSSAGAGGAGGAVGVSSLVLHGNFCVLAGSANYGSVTGCYVDGVFEYT